MQYICESTHLLVNEVAKDLIATGKDPIFLIEAFILNNKTKFNESALSNFWRDLKNWWKGGVGGVAAGRHDIESELNTAKNALLTMVGHIRKFKGSDPSVEADILNLLSTTVKNLRTAEPLITSLSGKIKKRAAAARDPRLYGGPEEYKPELDVAAFASLPVSNIKVEGGTKPIMNWYLDQASNNPKLARSIMMNAKVRITPSKYSAGAARDYEALTAASDPLITSLAGLGPDFAIRNGEIYGRVFGSLFEKLLASKSGSKDAKYADLPEYTVETAKMGKTEVNRYLNWLVRKGNAVVKDVMKETDLEIPMSSMSSMPISGTKLDGFSKLVDTYKKLPGAAATFESSGGKLYDSADIVRAVIYLNKKSQENLF